MDSFKKHHRKHIDKRLFFRLLLYFIISVVMIGVVIFEILLGWVSWVLALFGLVIGGSIGVVMARSFLLSWDKNAKKVISRLDLLGFIILVCYGVFIFYRNQIIADFVQANYVTGTSLSVIAGIMIGRVLGTGNKIVAILKEEKVIKRR